MENLEIKPNQVYTLEETATLLRVSLVTARRWAADGLLPSVKVGRAHRILGQALINLLMGQGKKEKDHDSEK